MHPIFIMLALPSVVLAVICARRVARTKLRGYHRLFALAFSISVWFAPALTGNAHGVLPIPFGWFLLAVLFQPNNLGDWALMSAPGLEVFLLGLSVLVLGVATVLRLFFGRWALQNNSDSTLPATED